VPSFLHEALLDILREHPELIADLLRHADGPLLPKHDSIAVDNASVGDVIPRELAADCLLRLEHKGTTILTVVLEVQLAVDPDKLFSAGGSLLRLLQTQHLPCLIATRNTDYLKRAIRSKRRSSARTLRSPSECAITIVRVTNRGRECWLDLQPTPDPTPQPTPNTSRSSAARRHQSP
jgi:hypothetical protein